MSKKVKKGDLIEIVNPITSFGDYKLGDVFTVKDGDHGEPFVTVEEVGLIIYEEEYKIIEEDEIPAVHDSRIKELEVEVAKLKSCIDSFTSRGEVDVSEEVVASDEYIVCDEVKDAPMSDNKKRAIVIDVAKKYIIDTEAKLANGLYMIHGNVGVCKYRKCFVEYVHDAEGDLVMVLIRGKTGSKEIYATQTSPYRVGAVYNEDIAKAVALSRALGDHSVVLEDLPQPTELVPGMIVYDTFEDVGSGVHNELEVATIADPVYYAVSSRDSRMWKYTEWYFEKYAVILDDTNADYSAFLDDNEGDE